jgi:hypothetical protein
MTRGLLKQGIILILFAALLFFMCPVPSFADSGTTILILLGLAFIVVLIIHADQNLFKGMFFDAYGLDSNGILQWAQDTQAMQGRDMFYDCDWLLTPKLDNRLWTGAGVTMRFSPTSADYFSELAYGGNIVMGYNTDDWNYMARFIQFDDETIAKLEATYRF